MLDSLKATLRATSANADGAGGGKPGAVQSPAADGAALLQTAAPSATPNLPGVGAPSSAIPPAIPPEPPGCRGGLAWPMGLYCDRILPRTLA